MHKNHHTHDSSEAHPARVTSDQEQRTTTVRPDGLPNERVGRAWDAKIENITAHNDVGDEAEISRNLKRETDTPAALETVDPSARPSRKSTRGSSSHLKGATPKTTQVKTQTNNAKSRALRAHVKH